MTQEDVLEGNELIARFMGGLRVLNQNGIIRVKSSDPEIIDKWVIAQYDHDWNWLMEVINRISRDFCNDFEITIYPSSCHIKSKKISFMGTGKMISSVYECVVEFIKWYNNKIEVTW